MRLPFKVLAVALVSVFVMAAEVANMSGNWTLNVKRSKWGKKPPPQSVSITIDHKEPQLKYTGVVTQSTESGPTKFEFAGAIDGKEYVVTEGGSQRKVTVRRLNDTSTTSTLRTDDPKTEETTKTTISGDGRTLIREVKHRGPDGSREWTEIYEKQ